MTSLGLLLPCPRSPPMPAHHPSQVPSMSRVRAIARQVSPVTSCTPGLILAPPRPGWVFLGKLLSLSEHQIPHPLRPFLLESGSEDEMTLCGEASGMGLADGGLSVLSCYFKFSLKKSVDWAARFKWLIVCYVNFTPVKEKICVFLHCLPLIPLTLTHTLADSHSHTRSHLHAHIHTRTCLHTLIHTYTHLHTHTHSLSLTQALADPLHPRRDLQTQGGRRDNSPNSLPGTPLTFSRGCQRRNELTGLRQRTGLRWKRPGWGHSDNWGRGETSAPRTTPRPVGPHVREPWTVLGKQGQPGWEGGSPVRGESPPLSVITLKTHTSAKVDYVLSL